jgi:hypothetical protein
MDRIINTERRRALHVLSKFGTADLSTLGQLLGDLERAIPRFPYKHDASPLYAMDYSSFELVSALAAATSKGLGLITPLFSSTSSSTCLPQHSDALRCLISCTSMCGSAMTKYRYTEGGDMRAVTRKSVQVAVAAKSQGVLQACGKAVCRI